MRIGKEHYLILELDKVACFFSMGSKVLTSELDVEFLVKMYRA